MCTDPFIDDVERLQQEILCNSTIALPFLEDTSSSTSEMAFTNTFVLPFFELAVITSKVALDFTFPFADFRLSFLTLTPSE